MRPGVTYANSQIRTEGLEGFLCYCADELGELLLKFFADIACAAGGVSRFMEEGAGVRLKSPEPVAFDDDALRTRFPDASCFAVADSLRPHRF